MTAGIYRYIASSFCVPSFIHSFDRWKSVSAADPVQAASFATQQYYDDYCDECPIEVFVALVTPAGDVLFYEVKPVITWSPTLTNQPLLALPDRSHALFRENEAGLGAEDFVKSGQALKSLEVAECDDVDLFKKLIVAAEKAIKNR